MKRKTIRAAVSTLLLLSMLAASLAAAQAVVIRPMYTGISSITSNLSISSDGAANCNGKATTQNGHTVDLTVQLRQNGKIIKTWTASGSGVVSAGGIYYVASGYSYYVTTTANVYTSGGTLIESISKNSSTVTY